MRETDVLIAPHGAALTNLLFLPKHSAAVELLTSPWYEPGYQPTALVFAVHYQVGRRPAWTRSVPTHPGTPTPFSPRRTQVCPPGRGAQGSRTLHIQARPPFMSPRFHVAPQAVASTDAARSSNCVVPAACLDTPLLVRPHLALI